MNTKTAFQKFVLAVLIAALVLAAFPMTSALAAGQTDLSQPPAGEKGVSDDRLENVWDRMLNRYDRIGKMFDSDTKLADRAEQMIARLQAEGKSTTELEAALAAYEAAVKQAHPIYESCKGIINSHKGFDEEGKVTDSEFARETIQDLAGKMKEIKETMNGTGKTLLGLMKSIREEYLPTPTPASGS